MSRNQRHFLAYGFLAVLSGLAVYFLVRLGSSYFSDVPLSPISPGTLKANSNTLFVSLTALLVVITVTRIFGSLFKMAGQPAVIGEVLGGILLGPSFLMRFAPSITDVLLPEESAPFLSVIAQIGILLFMFIIGLEFDLSGVRKAGKAALAISHSSIIVPFLLGVGLAFGIYRDYAPAGIPFSSFSLFIGVSMSVTAFPVLARILTDLKLNKTPIGLLALTCAAIDDATAWCLLAIVVGILQSSMTGAVMTIGMTVAYVIVMFLAVKPLFAKLIPRLEKSSEHISETSFALMLICLLISALATELIGIHALFGGFLVGAVIPNDSKVAADLEERLKDLVRILFLPAFFAFTGMRTEIGLLTSLSDWGLCLAIIFVATLGKFGGAFAAGKFSGMNTRDSAIIGVLMNTRGLVQLIVLNIGLDLGVLTTRLFTALVIMALITTFMTGPALRLLYGKELARSPA